MTAAGVELLEGFGVTVAWAPSMTYAALWVPDYCVMVVDASRDRFGLNEAIEGLMPSVRRRMLPEAVPADW
jgi:hypothetical protein